MRGERPRRLNNACLLFYEFTEQDCCTLYQEVHMGRSHRLCFFKGPIGQHSDTPPQYSNLTVRHLYISEPPKIGNEKGEERDHIIAPGWKMVSHSALASELLHLSSALIVYSTQRGRANASPRGLLTCKCPAAPPIILVLPMNHNKGLIVGA